MESHGLRVAMLARAVYPLHGYGGIERHVFHLCTHLARRGVAVTLYVQPPTDGPATLPGVARIETLRYDRTSPLIRPNSIAGRQLNYPWYSWQLGRRVARAVHDGQFDVVHAQGLCAFGYAALHQHDARLRQVPFITNPHGLEEYRTPDWRKWLAYAPFRALYSYGTRGADRAIATDECTRDDLPRYLGVAPERVVVIPSAIDADECLAPVNATTRHTLRTRLQLDEASLTFLSVGRLEHNKGYHIAIAALARLSAHLPAHWRWLLVGSGNERAALEAQAHAAGIGAHVRFIGRLDDDQLHNLYEDVDLVIHPTLYEGSSLVTLEGMIHRRPIVASAAGGIPDKIIPDVNGILGPPGDPAALAAGIRRALAARAAWPAWGEASVAIVRATFDWPVVARRTIDVYHAMRRSMVY